MPYATWTDQPLLFTPLPQPLPHQHAPPPHPLPMRAAVLSSITNLQVPQPMPTASPHFLAAHNEVQLNEPMLRQVLEHFSTLLPYHFPSSIRLVVHGGACFLLDSRLSSIIAASDDTYSTNGFGTQGHVEKRTTTRDVDYINRSFAATWKMQGVQDATERLKKCIGATATKFSLGMDWMNSDADVALPMATDPQGRLFDPICHASESDPSTVIFTSSNGWLTLSSVTPWWALAMKFMRYRKQDPQDIQTLLKRGSRSGARTWTPEFLESKLNHWCWPLVYYLDPMAKASFKAKMQHAVGMFNASANTSAFASTNALGLIDSSLPPSRSVCRSASATFARADGYIQTYTHAQPSSNTHLAPPQSIYAQTRPTLSTSRSNSSLRLPPPIPTQTTSFSLTPSPVPSVQNSYVHTSYNTTTPAIPFVDPAYAKCSDPGCTCQANKKPGLKWASWTSDPYFLEKIRKMRGVLSGS